MSRVLSEHWLETGIEPYLEAYRSIVDSYEELEIR